MKDKFILKVLSFFMFLVCVMSFFVFPSLADESETTVTEETTEGLTEPADKDYTYKMYFERMESFDTSSLSKEAIISLTSSSLTDTGFEGDFNNFFTKTFNEGEGLTKLLFRGWFLTDFGVEKYKVCISESGSNDANLIIYDAYNYKTETFLTDGVKKLAEDNQFYDYAHNAHFDIDIDFSDFENCMIDITVVAVTRSGDEISIIKLTNVPINICHYDSCRYCGGSTYFSIYDPDLYSHVYHRSYYTCESCSKQTIVNENHNWNYFEDRGVYGCMSCGVSSQTGPNCTYWDYEYNALDSYYHEVRQYCEICGGNMKIKAHNFADNKCRYCGYELVNSDINTPDDNDDNSNKVPITDNTSKDDNDKSFLNIVNSLFEDMKGLFALFLMVDLILVIIVVIKAFKQRR